ncbi:hypothetical protein LSH36_76g04001 [Paralvinella palmiformis]|uniref:Cationic amino acid transporter C-terminal domain-containing protein n=1 Tax=Paralvinella palmiformis TaxID=53620 RepID=A0AAD9NB69_9ANNE|nr:hypothetical protein LSH36_76g04001 [Paralvinella palmiformis]
MASTLRRRLHTLQYRMQRLKSTSLTENIYVREEPRLHTIFDMMLIALSTIFPFSVFVISGYVVKDLAGPSAILSLIFTSLASGLAGLSYSELRARVHRVQSSAYEYTYRVIGEATAFLIGWLLILHHVACTSTIARAISQNLDYLLENRISNLTVAHLGSLSGIGSYLDFVAFFIGLLIMIASVLDLGLRGVRIQLVSVGASLTTILFLLIVCLYHLNFHRWQDVNSFFPHGIGGVMSAATVLSYAFWSSETILRSCDLNSRGLRKPAVAAILSVHIISMVVLILTLSAITLLADSWSTDTPLAETFTSAGISWIRFIICPITMLVLSPTLCHQYKQSVTSLGQMAADGLLPEMLWDRNSRTDTPLVAIIAVGVTCSLCSLLFSISYLVQIVPIPIIAIQILSCLTTICFHYKPEDEANLPKTSTKRRRERNGKHPNFAKTNGSVTGSTRSGPPSGTSASSSASSYGATIQADTDRLLTDDETATFRIVTNNSSPPSLSNTTNNSNNDSFNSNNDRHNDSSSDTDIDDIVDEYEHELCVRQLRENTSPAEFRKRSSKSSFHRARAALVAFMCASIVLGLLVCDGGQELKRHKILAIVVLSLTALGAVASAVVIACQPRDVIQPYTVMMYVHHVPWTPLVALVMNVMMLSAISLYSALVTFIWIILGLFIYIFYAMTHSHEAMYPEDYPEEERELIGQIFVSQPRQSSNSGPSTIQDGLTEQDDDCLLDCT